MKALRIFEYFTNSNDNWVESYSDKELIQYVEDAKNEIIKIQKDLKVAKILNLWLSFCLICLLILDLIKD